MLDQIRPGDDIIVVWELDRLARSTRDLLNTMDTITVREAAKRRGVRFGRPRKLNTDQRQVARGIRRQ